MQADDLSRIFREQIAALERLWGQRFTPQQVKSYLLVGEVHGFQKAKEALAVFLSVQVPGRYPPLAKELDRYIRKNFLKDDK